MYLKWRSDAWKPLALRTVRSSLKSLRAPSQDDTATVLLLNHAIAALGAAIKPADLGPVPTVGLVIRHLDRHLAVMEDILSMFIGLPEGE